MSYEQQFIDECLKNEKIGMLIKESCLDIDTENWTISFGATQSKITILPFNIDANTDGEFRIQFDDYQVLFLLDGIAHYGDSKKIAQTIEIFAELVGTIFERDKVIEVYSLWGISRVRIKAIERTYTSMPFDKYHPMREAGQFLPIVSLGRRSTLG